MREPKMLQNMLEPNYIFQIYKMETMECNGTHFGKI